MTFKYLPSAVSLVVAGDFFTWGDITDCQVAKIIDLCVVATRMIDVTFRWLHKYQPVRTVWMQVAFFSVLNGVGFYWRYAYRGIPSENDLSDAKVAQGKYTLLMNT